jgi:hypothetical protein
MRKKPTIMMHESKNQKTHAPNLMRHIRQKLTLTPIRQLRRLSRSRVLLNTIPQVEHHLVDLRLQRIHLSTGFNRDEPREITVHRRR